MRCDTSRPPTRAIADGARAGGRVGCSVCRSRGLDLGGVRSGRLEGDSGVVSGGWRTGEIGGAIRWRELYREIVDSDKMWYRAIFGSLLVLVLVLELDVDRMSGSALCLDWDATARVRRLGWCIVYHGTLTAHAESPFLLRRVPNSPKAIIIVYL